MSRLQDNYSNTDMLSGDLIRKFVNENLSDKSYAKLQELPNNVKDYVSQTRTVPIWYIYDSPIIPDPTESLQISQFGDNSKFGIPQMPGSVVKVKKEELKELPKKEPERRKSQLCTALTKKGEKCKNLGKENGCCVIHQKKKKKSFKLPRESEEPVVEPAVVADDQINHKEIKKGDESQSRRPSKAVLAKRESNDFFDSLSGKKN